MDLTVYRREARRTRFLFRLGAALLCVALLLMLAFPPVQVQAVAVVDDIVVAAVIAALAAMGIGITVDGLAKSGVVEHIGELIDSYCTSASLAVADFVATVGGGVSGVGGLLRVAASVWPLVCSFASWLVGEYDLESEGEPVLVSGETESWLTLQDGSFAYVSVEQGRYLVSVGTLFTFSEIPIYLSDGKYINCFTSGSSYKFGLYSSSGSKLSDSYNGISVEEASDYYYTFASWTNSSTSNQIYFCAFKNDSSLPIIYYNVPQQTSVLNSYLNISSADTSLTLDPGIISIPSDEEANKDVILDVGATGATSLDDIADHVLDDTVANTLTVEEAAVDTPIEQEIEDVNELGLPSLGEYFTTRFPFSIPWDVARGVKLLAAPAKTPYFEVDFFAPIADKVGGWKGSTAIVLDFSEYEIIGQVSRWASTIGFCLLLAAGTKKLIWTA